jgi:predicted transcriptional regulator
VYPRLAAKLLHLHLYKINVVHKLSNTDYEARQNFLQQYSATVNGISEYIHCLQHAEFFP